MEKEPPRAYWNHERRKWVVDLVEVIVGETAQEADSAAEKRLALYHKAVEESDNG